jgi:hypothetical protein
LITGEGVPQLCDIMDAKLFTEPDDLTYRPTSEDNGRYLAPEIVYSAETPFPTLETDVYALGCVGLRVGWSLLRNL